ncbi:MAG TPA: hypothetical protein VF174_14100 [Micromonosporaceae bacterium]
MPGVPRELVERLYRTPPDGFTAARDEAVAAARRSGDPALAREIAKLRKPTVAAWLVNLLALRRPDLVADLVDLAGQLRAAQRDLRGAQLRELTAQRRSAVAALVDEARVLAREAAPASHAKLPLAEVEQTLNAALADPGVAERVRSGRLIRTVRYAGFGETPRPRLRLVTGEAAGAAPARRPAKADGERARRAEQTARRRRELERELAEARRRERRAETDLERAVAAEHDADRVLAEIETALAELERRRAAAEEEVSRRKLARKAAEREAVAARRRTGEVQAAVEALDVETG